MDWLALTVISALCVAASDAATKGLQAGEGSWERTAVRFGWSGALLSPIVFLTPWPDPDPRIWLWMAVLLPLDIAAMLLYMRALQVAPLHDTLPYVAFSPVFTAAAGWALLDERLSWAGATGIGLVTIGGYLLNVEAGADHWRDPLAPLRRMGRSQGARLMLGTAVLFGFTSVLGKGALQYAGGLWFGALYFGVLGLTTCMAMAIAKPAALPALWRRPVASTVVSAFFAVMIVTHFLALEQVETGYMMAVKRLSLLFGIVLGAVLFKEQHLGRHLAIGTIMVAGVALIAMQP